MRTSIAWLLALAPLAGTLAPLAEAAPLVQEEKGYYLSPKYGFRIKPPKGWNLIPLKTDEAWLGCKYLSDQSYFYTDKKTGYTSEQTPEFKVITFVKANMKRSKETEEVGNTTITRIRNPYKDYDDFLTATMGGSFYKDKTTKGELKTKDGEIEYEYHVYNAGEKLSGAPRYLHTYVFKTEEIDYAVQIDILQSEADKRSVKNVMDRTFKSFELIERSGESLADTSSGGRWVTFSERNKGTSKERRSKRVESEALLRERAIRSLPDDWKHSEIKGILVLTHTDKKYTKRVGEHVAAMLAWLEKKFPYVGKGEYARTPIIRICANEEEQLAFGAGVADNEGGYSVSRGEMEIFVSKSSEGFTTCRFVDFMNMQILWNWFYDRDEQLQQSLAPWFELGMEYVFEGGRGERGKVKFRENDYDVVNSKTYIAQGRIHEPRELFKLGSEDFRGQEAVPKLTQAYALTRFLLSPDAEKNRASKGVLEKYLTTMKVVVEELENKYDAEWADEEGPQTEEEEEEWAKARAERRKQRESEVIETVFDRTFGDWTDKDWDGFHKAFYKWLG